MNGHGCPPSWSATTAARNQAPWHSARHDSCAEASDHDGKSRARTATGRLLFSLGVLSLGFFFLAAPLKLYAQLDDGGSRIELAPETKPASPLPAPPSTPAENRPLREAINGPMTGPAARPPLSPPIAGPPIAGPPIAGPSTTAPNAGGAIGALGDSPRRLDGAANAANRLSADEVRVRIAWGGGTARQWRGRIYIQGAQIIDHRVLGLSPHSPGSLRVGANEVSIHQRFAQSYDGVDLTLRGDLHSKLRIDLRDITPERSPTSGGEAAEEPTTKTLEVELNDVVRSFRNVRLDGNGNQLLVRRRPGDWLRLGLDPAKTIFKPGETLAFSPQVLHSAFQPGATCRLRAQLSQPRGGREIWADERGFVADDDGSGDVQRPFEITLPTNEGVYDLHFTATDQADCWRAFLAREEGAPDAPVGDHARRGRDPRR